MFCALYMSMQLSENSGLVALGCPAYMWDICVCVNVDPSCLGRTIYARQFLGAKPPIQFCHRWSEINHSDHLYRLRAAKSVAQLINAKRQAEKRKPPSFYVFGVTRSGIEPRPPTPRADALTTATQGRFLSHRKLATGPWSARMWYIVYTALKYRSVL